MERIRRLKEFRLQHQSSIPISFVLSPTATQLTSEYWFKPDGYIHYRWPKPRALSLHQMLDVAATSETHQLHREADVPDGDILIHAGDYF